MITDSYPADSQRTAVAFGAAAYLSWGLIPMFFKTLRHVQPLEILAHRVLWSAVFLAGLVTLSRRWREFAASFRSPSSIFPYLLSTTLISCNWFLYIWTVNSGHVLVGSLGYFINPLVNVLLGVAFLGETLRPRQRLAVGLAAAGVAVLVFGLGTFPWVALALATSFGGYGLIRKKARIDPIVGLLVETTLLAPIAVTFMIVRAATGVGRLGSDVRTTTLLILGGVVTALPLIWFARGVRSLRLSTMGLMQYLSPTMQFLLAVLFYRETFTGFHALAFGCIWVSLAVYTTDALSAQRANAMALRARLRLR